MKEAEISLQTEECQRLMVKAGERPLTARTRVLLDVEAHAKVFDERRK